MTVLTSWTFWLIISAIIIVMALIGYLAEGTDLVKKQEKPKTDNIPVPEIKEEKPELPVEKQAVVSADSPIEILNIQNEPTIWSDNAVMPDERQEQVHNVPTQDNWMEMPVINNTNDISQNTPTNNQPEISLETQTSQVNENIWN